MILLTSLRVDSFLLFFSPLIYIFAKIYKIYIMEFLVNNVMYIAPFLGLVGLFVMFQNLLGLQDKTLEIIKWLAWLIILQGAPWLS